MDCHILNFTTSISCKSKHDDIRSCKSCKMGNSLEYTFINQDRDQKREKVVPSSWVDFENRTLKVTGYGTNSFTASGHLITTLRYDPKYKDLITLESVSHFKDNRVSIKTNKGIFKSTFQCTININF